VGPSESSAEPLGRGCFHLRPSSHEIGCPFRVPTLQKYRVYRFRDPTMPLAVPSALWVSLCRSGWSLLNAQPHPLFELTPSSRVSHGPDLADQPQPVSSSHGLLLPTAHQGPEVHLPRALPARYVPPSGFGCPLGGLLPPSPCRFCFAPAALMGFTLRSSPPKRHPQRFHRRSTHLPLSLSLFPTPKRRAGPTGRGSWVFTLSEDPGLQTRV
jgi:hypothetical protein